MTVPRPESDLPRPPSDELAFSALAANLRHPRNHIGAADARVEIRHRGDEVQLAADAAQALHVLPTESIRLPSPASNALALSALRPTMDMREIMSAPAFRFLS